jgi:hypothetical protein
MFGVMFSSSTSSSNWPPELGHRPSLRSTLVLPSNANRKLQHNPANKTIKGKGTSCSSQVLAMNLNRPATLLHAVTGSEAY